MRIIFLAEKSHYQGLFDKSRAIIETVPLGQLYGIRKA